MRVTVVLLTVGLSVFSFPDAVLSAGDSDLAEVIIEASNAANASLSSFVADGEFRLFERSQNDEDWRLTEVAAVSVRVKKPKYNIRFNYSLSREGLKERVIVFDSSAIITSRFSENITKTNCQGEVFSIQAGETARNPPGMAGFPWDLGHPDQCVLSVASMLQKHPEYASGLSVNAQGNILLESVRPGYKVTSVFSKHSGFNPTNFDVLLDGNRVSTQQRTARWVYGAGAWHVAALANTFIPNNWEDDDIGVRSELDFENFEVNAFVSDDYFRLAALGMPGGTRILDHRPEVERDVLYTPLSDTELVRHLDTVVATLSKLSDAPDVSGERPTEKSGLLWVVVFNSIFALILLFVFITHGRRKYSLGHERSESRKRE